MADDQAVVRLPASGVDNVVTGPLAGRTGAYLTVSDAASRIDVVLAALPGVLYRVSTPAESGFAPVVHARGNQVTTEFRPTGADGPDTVRIVLNRNVRWAISLPAGAGEQRLDLRGGRLAGVRLGACGVADLRLPAAAGTVPVMFTAGVGRIALTSPRVPARVVFGDGSGEVVTPWGSRSTTGPGEIVADPGWERARNRYAITATGAIGELRLTQSG